MHRHRHVGEHLVVDELVLLGDHEAAVEDKHPSIGGRVEDVNLLDGALLRGDLLDRLHREPDVLRVFVGIPEFCLHSYNLSRRILYHNRRSQTAVRFAKNGRPKIFSPSAGIGDIRKKKTPRTSVLRVSRQCWRKGGDSNPRWSCPHTTFPRLHHRPLGHPSSRCLVRLSCWCQERDSNPHILTYSRF